MVLGAVALWDGVGACGACTGAMVVMKWGVSGDRGGGRAGSWCCSCRWSGDFSAARLLVLSGSGRGSHTGGGVGRRW